MVSPTDSYADVEENIFDWIDAGTKMVVVRGKKAVEPVRQGFRFAWDEPRLCFSVREPFVSKASAAGIVWGNVRAGEKLEVVSQMPQDGVIFSDGVEADFLAFDSGASRQHLHRRRDGKASRRIDVSQAVNVRCSEFVEKTEE